MSQTTTEVGRAKLVHPNLEFDTDDGGTALYNALSAMWTAVSNHLPSRWTGSITLANNSTTVITHNFNLAIAKLKILIFEAGSQLTQAQITAAYTVTQNSVNAINVQNTSGGPKTFDVFIFSFRLGLTSGDFDPSYSPISDLAYDQTTWDGVTTTAPSKHAMRDKIVTMDASIAGKADPPLAMPALTGAQTVSNWLSALTPLHAANVNTLGRVISYAHGITAVSNAYSRGVYSPTQNRIYLIPRNQASAVNWHYIDCTTGNVVAYAHGVTAVSVAYTGGVYSPTQNRIYMIPANQATIATWHYINCDTGAIIPYAHGVIVSGNYLGGIYSPTQNRIYLSPYGQGNIATWHYIDCATGNVVAYAHGVTAVSSAYKGGAYSPTQNRIYLLPANQELYATWHYIDCNTGNVVAYAHGVTPSGAGAYGGITYSPSQNRIYLAPDRQCSATDWHYIDCATGNVIAYTHPGITLIRNAYSGGSVYSPAQNRIYLVPFDQVVIATWHYIDCNTGNIIAYDHKTGIAAYVTYEGAVYSPLQNRIYFVPQGIATFATWHHIQMTGIKKGICPHQFGSTILSSTL